MDEIDDKIIKSIHPCILDPLVHIINLIFVTPVYEPVDKTKISNYRLISVLNNFSKICEVSKTENRKLFSM